MSTMLSFLPMLIERSEMLKSAIQRILEEKPVLPTSEIKAHETTIRVIILDGQEWHRGATAPRISDFRRHAGKAGGP
jgi:hypothetical protein